MTAENFERALKAFLTREPFRPFTIVFKGGGREEIDRPDAIACQKGCAVYLRPGPVPVYFDHTCVVSFNG